MRILRSWSFLAPLAVCSLLAGWILLSVLNARAVGFSIFLFAVANLIVYTDALDFALRLYMRRWHTASAGGPEDEAALHQLGHDDHPAGLAHVAERIGIILAAQYLTSGIQRLVDKRLAPGVSQ